MLNPRPRPTLLDIRKKQETVRESPVSWKTKLRIWNGDAEKSYQSTPLLVTLKPGPVRALVLLGIVLETLAFKCFRSTHS